MTETEARYPELGPLYRWPFGLTDNPNVVIEPTTACNLNCAACYRGSNDPSRRQLPMTLPEIYAYIDEALSLRQFHTLSFLGGEPLLYRELDQAVLYARKRGLAVGVYTNGELLHKYRARELQTAGVSYIYVHVDRHQGRTPTTAETTALWNHFCEMFRKLKDVNFGIGLIVHEADLPDLQCHAEFFKANADVIRFVNLSLLGPLPPEHATTAQIVATSTAVDAFQRRACEVIRIAFGVEFCSYMGSKFRSEVPGKLMAATAYGPGSRVARMSAEQFGHLNERYRSEFGRYPYLLGKESTDDFAKHSARVVDSPWQYLVISLSPLLLPEHRWNVCHFCTDCVLYDHRFVPMCQLDPFKAGDPLVDESVRY